MSVPFMSITDWVIVLVSVVLLTWFSLRSAKYMQGVADFLSANRSAGRYLLSMALLVVGMGAITIVGTFEMIYNVGFAASWWGLLAIPAGTIITLTGWVAYRFRETRCLTLAQFFEVRYSRRFRIFAGSVIWFSGILNFAIFPYVASNFFVYFCGLPPELTLLGLTIPTYWPIMLLTLGMSLLYTTIGGQITVMITDCIQGIFVGIVFVFLALFLLSQFSWADITHSLKEYPEYRARQEAAENFDKAQAAYDEAVKTRAADVTVKKKAALDEALGAQTDEQIAKAAKGKSMMNPFDMGAVESFSIWFFLILVFNGFYGLMSNQGSQAYQSSGTSPHEQKMSGIISVWRGLIMSVTFILLSLCALTLLTHPDYVEASRQARMVLSELRAGDVPQLGIQQRVAVALAYILPMGLRGLFCVVMIFLLVTTQDTYMHSWGSIFIQDVVIPLRKKPFTPAQHVKWLRLSIIGVGAFAFFFACIYKPTEFIQMYLAITIAIVAGLGCAIIGGLYWKYSGTIAAYVAVGLGAVLSVTRIVVQQFTTQIADMPDKNLVFRFLDWANGLNSQYVWFYLMVISIGFFVILSFLEVRKPFDLNRMLHRGKYDVKDEHKRARDAVKSVWWKFVGITQEFTRWDRIFAYALVVWNLGWLSIFVIATIINYTVKPISVDWWSSYWKFWVWLHVSVGTITMCWFTVGAIRDLKRLFTRLSTIKRDDRDDGRIVGHHLAAEEDTIVAQADNSRL